MNNTRHNATIFVEMLLSHLKRFDMFPCIIQTDNGTEFVNTRNTLDETIFKHVIHRNGIAKHQNPTTWYQRPGRMMLKPLIGSLRKSFMIMWILQILVFYIFI